MEIGHVPPHLPLVNGAMATLAVDGNVHEIMQQLTWRRPPTRFYDDAPIRAGPARPGRRTAGRGREVFGVVGGREARHATRAGPGVPRVRQAGSTQVFVLRIPVALKRGHLGFAMSCSLRTQPRPETSENGQHPDPAARGGLGSR